MDVSNDPYDLSKSINLVKSNDSIPFKIDAEFEPAGDQENAIEKIVFQLENSQERCVLLGVTGSGKTFAMAHIIERLQIPTLILSHNKTLARQLWQEMSSLFPNNAVEYFVSHYDYYQPEAYVPTRDLYIDKELQMNERIEQERFSTVASLVTRPDVIVVGTVSTIYGLNPPETFLQHHVRIHVGQKTEPMSVVRELVELHYGRVTGSEFERGDIRLRGEILDIWMPSRDDPLRVKFGFEGIEQIQICEAISFEPLDDIEEAWIHPKEFYITSEESFDQALEEIENDRDEREQFFKSQGKDLEAHRIVTRTDFDVELLKELGTCKGIENYSRYFDGRNTGDRPYCLFDFMAACSQSFHGNPKKYLVIMDESHVTLPQLSGMHAGDKSRKANLIDYGFRLPSAFDNRPLRIDEFQSLVPQMLYVSATPGERELRHLAEVTNQKIPEGLLHVPGGGGAIESNSPKKKSSMLETMEGIEDIVRMEIRPTGLLDPEIEVRSTEGQVQDLLDEINYCIKNNERVLVTVLTIKFAEEVAEYLLRMGIKAHYLHSEIGTIERSEIIKALRIGHIDVIVGINLLREGLDIPEVSLVAIFDADREGFLRNERSLLQTIGRAARNENGRVILYSDSVSPSMQAAINQTLERRLRQEKHNEENGISPTTIQKSLPTMGEEIEGLLAGTAGKGSTGGKRFVGSFTGKSKQKQDSDIVKKFGLGVGTWNEHSNNLQDSVLSNISQPSWVEAGEITIQMESNEDADFKMKLVERLKKEMTAAAARLEFERAAKIRDRIIQLENEIFN
ncbi:MAG: excinuclease ABC subunit B [Euryarchaeota archaeon]|nr:excinuclease ABC subunit B [Euryarchaeota archaeon]|tara:strand:+ start:397 stop:2775 length:2379 start_codon:yes stop_codon:yes gene_type:complete